MRETDPDVTHSEATPGADPDATVGPEAAESLDETIDFLEPADAGLPSAARDPAQPVRPELASPEPPRTVDAANAPRGPPELERKVKLLDRSGLDPNLSPDPDHPFARQVYDPKAIPHGGDFSGKRFDVPQKDGSIWRLPGAELTAPGGSKLALGEFLGQAGSATVFVSRDDPSKVVRLVDFSDPAASNLDVVGRKIGAAIQNPTGNGNFRLTRTEQQFVMTDPATGKTWLATVEENGAITGGGYTNAKARFASRPANDAETLTMAAAMREMNNRGVVWTDQKLANFDIITNPEAPTGYQMLIFDTGGIRPVTGATASTRAATARDIQAVFDNSPHSEGLDLLTFQSSRHRAFEYLDDRVFGADPGLTFSFEGIGHPDKYLDHSGLTDAQLDDYAKAILGREVDLLIAPP